MKKLMKDTHREELSKESLDIICSIFKKLKQSCELDIESIVNKLEYYYYIDECKEQGVESSSELLKSMENYAEIIVNYGKELERISKVLEELELSKKGN